MHARLASLLVASVLLPACFLIPASSSASFDAITDSFLDWHFEHHPTSATVLGVHRYDDRLADFSPDARLRDIADLHTFLDRFEHVAPDSIPQSQALDLEFVKGVIRSQLLDLEVIRPFARDPDTYSAAVTQAAFYLIKRDFAPAEERMRTLVARERRMPEFLALARKNLENPPRILTEIAIEQLDGNRDFFKNDVPLAFAGVKDAALRKDFDSANGTVIAALEQYKAFLVGDLLARSNGDFALGEDTYRKKLQDEEDIDVPLDQLLAVADADLKKNQAAFAETAKQIDATRPPAVVFDELSRKHPAPKDLLAVTQASLDSIKKFIVDRGIITIPEGTPATVAETPPFMRSTTSASMDTPGPFEKKARESYYFMTLPDPASSAADQDEFMRQWYEPMISNVSVHEAWPGHYMQFLYASRFPSRIRQVFGANTNVEGWAHYCEQMMLDEGFHAGEPAYRLAQLQDALLRDARCIVGIRMHTRGMKFDDVKKFFEEQAYQPEPVALSEAKRGTTDALYGYYTLGKLMIMKLRDDYRAAHPGSSLRDFHDAFMPEGPLPLPLLRRALLGSEGTLLP